MRKRISAAAGGVVVAIGIYAATGMLSPTPAMALEVLRAARDVPGDLVLLARVLTRRSAPDARTVRVPFPATGRDPHAAAARATAVIAGSLAPNSVVIEIDEEHDELLVHRLADPR